MGLRPVHSPLHLHCGELKYLLKISISAPTEMKIVAIKQQSSINIKLIAAELFVKNNRYIVNTRENVKNFFGNTLQCSEV